MEKVEINKRLAEELVKKFNSLGYDVEDVEEAIERILLDWKELIEYRRDLIDTIQRKNEEIERLENIIKQYKEITENLIKLTKDIAELKETILLLLQNLR